MKLLVVNQFLCIEIFYCSCFGSQVAGKATPQLYVTFPESAGEPPLQLKGFDDVFLLSGQTKIVNFPLNARTWSTWSVDDHAWEIAQGEFTFSVGASSRDIRVQQTLPATEIFITK